MGYGTIACSLSAISQLRPLNLLKLNRLNLHYAEVTCITVVTCSCPQSEWRISMNGFRSCIFTLPFCQEDPLLGANPAGSKGMHEAMVQSMEGKYEY